ncbi:MAG: DnaJ domain-containing protein [Elusimicrobiota bacterium]
MIKYKQLDNARKKLGLSKRASLEEIKKKFKKLSLKYHPDRCEEERKEECKEKFQEINEAYKILRDYGFSYKISFKEKDFKENSPDGAYKRHFDRFYKDLF